MANPVKIKAKVVRVERHADGVASYAFEPQGRVPKFLPGQFLHLALDDYDPSSQWPESRVFSIASSPGERRTELAVTISAKGRFTERIYDALEEGGHCWLKLPYGEFLFPNIGHLVLIAGGVGITPYLSLLKKMLEDRSEQAVTLYYGVRSSDYYLFKELLQACLKELPNFKLVVYAEEDFEGAESGRLPIDRIHDENTAESHYFLSGPPVMIDTFRSYLSNQEVPPEHIHVDDWE